MRVREFGDTFLVRLLDSAVGVIPGALGAGLSAGEEARRVRSAGRAPRGRDDRDDPEGLRMRPVAGVGVAASLDRAQIESGQGPIWEALRSGQVVVEPLWDERAAERWPALLAGLDPDAVPALDEATGEPAERDLSGCAESPAGRAPSTGTGEVTRRRPALGEVGTVVAVPGECGEPLPLITSLYLDGPPGTEVLSAADRLESLLSHAFAVVEHCAGEEVRAEQMLQMIQYRRVVEQAKGAVMVAVGTDAPGAFEVLSRASQHFNVRLRNLAVALVEHVGGGEAEHPDDPSAVVVPTESDRRVAAQVWSALRTSRGRDGDNGPDDAGRQGGGRAG